MPLLFAALMVSAACAPLPEETSETAPSVASSTVVLAGVELSGPVSVLVPESESGGFSSGASVTDTPPARIFLLHYERGVLRLTLDFDERFGGLDESEGALWCPRLSGGDALGEPVWIKVMPARRGEAGKVELADRPVLADLDFKAEFGLPFVPYRPVAVAAVRGGVAIAWCEREFDSYTFIKGAAFVTLSDAASGALLARSARVTHRGSSVRLHALADMTGDGEPELAVGGELDDLEQFVVLDGRELCELSRAVVSGVRGPSFRSRRTSTVVGQERDRVVLLDSSERFGARRVDFRIDGASPTISYQPLSQLSPTFDVRTVVAFDGDSVLASFSDHRSHIGTFARDCLWAVIPDVARPEGQMATIQPVLFAACSAGWPSAWPIPDWDGDGRSEVLATDGIGGLLLFPSTRLSAPLHVASPEGWEVGGRSTSVVEHAGRQLVVTSAKRLSDSSSWTCVMELRPRMAAPGPVGR